MEYTTQNLSKLANISARTLRYYDEIGLLKPIRQSSNGYRIYGQQEVDKLQQIMFYKTMGLELDTIKQLLENPDFDAIKAMETHLEKLKTEHEKLQSLIEYVNTTISHMKGDITMSDKEKFEIYKDELVKNNEVIQLKDDITQIGGATFALSQRVEGDTVIQVLTIITMVIKVALIRINPTHQPLIQLH